MMKTGWWSVKFELTMEGEEVRWDDLDEATQEHIAECIKEGYTSGEIVTEEDESYTASVYEMDLTEEEAEAEEVMNHYDEGCKKWSELFAKMK